MQHIVSRSVGRTKVCLACHATIVVLISSYIIPYTLDLYLYMYAACVLYVAHVVQECAVVPANPFPEPTNGMAVARWQHAKTLVASDAEDTPDTEDTPHTPNETCRRSPKLADIAQAAITAALKFKGNDEGAGADAMLGKQDGDITPGASPGLDDSDDSVDGSRRALFRGRTGGNSKGMRQESYYLRGVVEAERDRDLLSVIANCLPGEPLPLLF